MEPWIFSYIKGSCEEDESSLEKQEKIDSVLDSLVVRVCYHFLVTFIRVTVVTRVIHNSG